MPRYEIERGGRKSGSSALRITIIVVDWQFCYRIDPDGLFGKRNGRIDKDSLSKRAPISVRFLFVPSVVNLHEPRHPRGGNARHAFGS